MSVFPVVLDQTAPHLGGAPTGRSLLLTPVGSGTLLGRLNESLERFGSRVLTVAPSFDADDAYRVAVRHACGDVERVVSPGQFGEFVSGLEPSDWLLFVDPTCVPDAGTDPDLLVRMSAQSPRTAVHLVALESNAGGTVEWVDVDERGDISHIRRYYDAVTWPYASGVAASLVPVSCLLTARNLRVDSLRSLRLALAAHGVPARDVPIEGRAFDLSHERELLMFVERVVSSLPARGEGRSYVAANATVHESARLLGPVVVQDGACIEEKATLVGPTVVGAGARIGSDSVVAQCVVRSGAVVPPHSVWRHRLLPQDAGAAATQPALGTSYDPSTVRPLGPDLHDRPPRLRVYPVIKIALESVLAVAALIVLLPLLLVVAALIKLESRGPVFFSDRREAKGGRNFDCLKFRTMQQGADAMQRALLARNEVDGPQFKLEKDPRLTRVGRWIRPCSVDELPQLINVARGQMSLVGPRPSPFRENQTCVPWREGRLSVRPGITGLWQVCRHDRAGGDFHQWIHYDLLYVEHMSAMVDLKIVLATIATLGGKWCVPLTWIIPAGKLRTAA